MTEVVFPIKIEQQDFLFSAKKSDNTSPYSTR